jgi:hypothetical protein
VCERQQLASSPPEVAQVVEVQLPSLFGQASGQLDRVLVRVKELVDEGRQGVEPAPVS